MGRMRDLGLAVTQLINRKQLYAWLLAASAVLDAQGDALGPFNTIATGAQDSGRMIDVSLETLRALEAGAECWTLSVRDRWRWDPTSTLVADNITVCKPTSLGAGAGAFIRELIPALEWFGLVTAWSVDTNNGSDENLGNAASPLKTNAELMRRWGKKTSPSGVALSILWPTSPPASDPLSLDVTFGPSATLTMLGQTTVTAAGTFSAFTGPNRTPGAQAMPTATDGAQNWASFVGSHGTIINNVNGNVGTNFVVLKDQTAGVARISTPLTFATATATSTRKTLANGDQYQIYSVPVVTVGSLAFRLADSAVATSYVFTQDVSFSMPQTFSATTKLWAKGIRVMSIRTTWSSLNAECDAQVLSSCWLPGGPVLRWGAFCKAHGGGTNGNISVFAGSAPTLDFDFCFQGPGSTLALGIGSNSTFGTIAFFDSAGGLTAQATASVLVQTLSDTTGTIWGTTASGFGVTDRSGAAIVYATVGNKPVINSGLGAGREASIGGTDKLWSAVPFVEPTNNAMIVLNA